MGTLEVADGKSALQTPLTDVYLYEAQLQQVTVPIKHQNSKLESLWGSRITDQNVCSILEQQAITYITNCIERSEALSDPELKDEKLFQIQY